MKSEEPMRNINPFGLRMQPDLKARIEEAADKNRRSINAEIVARLEATFAIDEALDEIAPGAPIYEAAPIILDLAKERDEAHEALHDLNLEIHSKVLLEQFSHNTAMLEKIDSRIEYLVEQAKQPKE